MEVCAVWLARDFLRTAGRPIDIPPCGCSADLCPPITEGAEMPTNREVAEAVIDEIKAEGVTKPYVHDWSEETDWTELCIPAELGVAHPPHAYLTAEPSGCPGYDPAAA